MGVPEGHEHQSLGAGYLQLAVGGGVEGRPGNAETDALACLALRPVVGAWLLGGLEPLRAISQSQCCHRRKALIKGDTSDPAALG